jgi:hypothetical protein
VGKFAVFVFDEGRQLHELSAPYHALVYVSEDEAERIVSKKIPNGERGGIIITPGSGPCSASEVSQFKIMPVVIRE